MYIQDIQAMEGVETVQNTIPMLKKLKFKTYPKRGLGNFEAVPFCTKQGVDVHK